MMLNLDREKKVSTDVTYKIPLKRGRCSVYDNGNNGRRHAHCRCKNTQEPDCKKKCDIDSSCKGYSYRNATNSVCYLYTTSICNHPCGTSTKHKGYTGDLIEFADKNESGCFI